jgi:hypothetical protein
MFSKKKIGFLILLSLAVFVIWGSGIYYGQYINENYQSVSIRMKKDEVTKHVLIRAMENEMEKGTKDIPEITAWDRQEEAVIENQELYTKSKVHLIEVYGDIKQVYPMELTSGSIPAADDYRGCLIDENSAYELFHTSDAVGAFLSYQNKRYCIRGIVKSPDSLCIFQVLEENKAYSNLELVYEDKENGKKLAGEFMLQNGLSSSYTIIEGCFYAKLLELFYLVPAWFLGFALLIRFLKSLWKRRNLPLQVLALILLLAVVWTALRWLMEFQLYIPERLIPTKWSDFTFWTEKYSAFQSQRREIAFLTPNPKDVILIQSARRCINYSLIALAGMITFVIHQKIILCNNNSMKMSIITVIIEGVAILLLFKTGKSFELPRGYLCMLPLYIIGITLYNELQRWILHPRYHELR